MDRAKDYGGLLSAMYDALSSDVAPLKITAWTSPEPLEFERRFEGKCVELHEGEAWGERLFDCAWMRFDVEIPQSESLDALALKIDINGELYIADDGGSPVCGLTCKSSNFCDVLGKPGKTFYELPGALKEKRKFSVWADCGLNDLFGNLKGGGKIVCARLVRLDPIMRRLMHDFEFVHSWAFDFEGGSEKHSALRKAVEDSAELLEHDFEDGRESAAQILENAMFSETDASALEVSGIGHAHMDLAWLWPIRETKRKLARTFATALMLGEKYPCYLYGASQPQAFSWMQEEYPKLYARIKKAVAQGRIEPLGCMWVEPDCNLPSGESFIRQILHGRKFFNGEFGVSPDYFWIPDSFGYSPQLPQILLKSGVKYFVTQKMSWNSINRFPHHSFWWEGIDGSRVLAHMLPEETYNSPALPRSLIKIEREYAQRNVSKNALMAFGIGDGGGGPGIEHLERIERNGKSKGLPAIVQRRVPEFFKRLEEESENFPVWRGDLYLEKHQGTYTTQGKNKRYNRSCEALLRDAELMLYLDEMHEGKTLDRSFLDEIWKEVLLYQFHDILPGSSIKRVYDESQARYKELKGRLVQFVGGVIFKFVEREKCSLEFNSSSWARLSQARTLSDSGATVPAFGYMGIAGDSEIAVEKSDGTVLEDKFLKASFNDRGLLVSLVDKKSGMEFIDASSSASQFLVYEDTDGDAWDFGYDYRKKSPDEMALTSAEYRCINGSTTDAHFEFSYGASTLSQHVRLVGGKLIFRTKLDWHDKDKMLRLRFPLAFDAKKSASEVAFGYYEREVDDSNEWRRARIETPAHQWAAMKGDNAGLAILNNGKYGHRLKGNAIELNILRCVPCPGEALVSVSDSIKKSRPDANSDYADIGEQDFSYALYPYSGEFKPHEIAAHARGLNNEILPAIHDTYEGRELSKSFISIDSPEIELVAMKPAEDGKNWIARFVNLSANNVTANIDFAFVPQKTSETDLSENILSGNTGMKNLDFKPHEIRSFKLEYELPEQ